MKTALLVLTAALLAGPAVAQTAANGTASRAGNTGGRTDQVDDRDRALADTGTVALTPARGLNSFSRAQAMRRIQGRGFMGVTGLRKDADGVWRGTGNKAGASVQVWLDFRGNVGQAGGARPVAGLAATAPGVGSPAAVTDGMAGNPPGTAARRATNLAVGVDTTEARPDGSPTATPR